jgi:hypothetical protein
MEKRESFDEFALRKGQFYSTCQFHGLQRPKSGKSGFLSSGKMLLNKKSSLRLNLNQDVVSKKSLSRHSRTKSRMSQSSMPDSLTDRNKVDRTELLKGLY